MATHVESKKSKVARILVSINAGGALVGTGNGTGFFISETGELLTCAHVALALPKSEVIKHKSYIDATGAEHDKFVAFYKACILQTKAIFEDSVEVDLDLVDIIVPYDIAVFRAKTGKVDAKRIFETDFTTQPAYGMHVNFVGFPEAVGYPPEKNPFAFNAGYISAFPETQIGGDKYEHMQISALNLGGNSGGPLFVGESEAVIGVVNGNWSKNNVPIVAYATSLKLLKEKTIL